MGNRFQGQGPVLTQSFTWRFGQTAAADLIPNAVTAELVKHYWVPTIPWGTNDVRGGIVIVDARVFAAVATAGAPSFTVDVQDDASSLLTAVTTINTANDGAWVAMTLDDAESGTFPSSGAIGKGFVAGGSDLTINIVPTGFTSANHFPFIDVQFSYYNWHPNVGLPPVANAAVGL